MVAGYVNEMENAREHGTDDSFMIRIGQEITLEGLDDCSFITATYYLTDSASGNIGVIGPKRMLYSKVISQIDFVKKKLNKEMQRFT
jgi:heat-inducible transcriptional repressor